MAHPGTAKLSIGLALLTGCLSSGRAAEPSAVPRRLYVAVEKDGVPVTGLDGANFHLYVNGQPLSFQLERPEPASVALLLENSTTSWRGFQQLNAPIRSFLEHAPQNDDTYALAAYSRSLFVAFEFTRQADLIPEVYAALGRPLWSDINTYDAVYGMLERLGRIQGRRILVLIGSGLDTLSGYTLEDVKRKIEAENVTVFAIGTGSLFADSYSAALGSAAASHLAGARSFLEMLAMKSGGGAWFPNQTAEVPSALNDILGRIAAQYCLVYEPPRLPAGKFESVKVEVAAQDGQANLTVLAREGWR